MGGCSASRASEYLASGENAMKDSKSTLAGDKAALDTLDGVVEAENKASGKNVMARQLQGVEGAVEDYVSGTNLGEEAAADALDASGREVMTKELQGVEDVMEDNVRTGLAGGLIDERSASATKIVKTSARRHGSDFLLNQISIDILQLIAGTNHTTHGQVSMDTVKLRNTYTASDKDQGLLTCRTDTSGVGLGVIKITDDGKEIGRIDQDDKTPQPKDKKISCEGRQDCLRHVSSEGNSCLNQNENIGSYSCQASTRNATNDEGSDETLSMEGDMSEGSPCRYEGQK